MGELKLEIKRKTSWRKKKNHLIDEVSEPKSGSVG